MQTVIFLNLSLSLMHSSSAHHLKKFAYIDSSEQEQEQLPPNPSKNTTATKTRKHLRILPLPANPLTQSHPQQLERIVQEQIDKIQGGNAMLIEPNDKQIEENAKMVQNKYQYFIKQMQIDQRYAKIMDDKVSRLKEENLRKQEILKRKREEDHRKQEEQLVKKYIVEKEERQGRVIHKVKQMVHKLGVERNVHTSQQIRQHRQKEKGITQKAVQNVKNVQRDRLSQLRQKYDELKAEKKLNELQQKKMLKDLQRKNQQQKKRLKDQLLIKKTFQV